MALSSGEIAGIVIGGVLIAVILLSVGKKLQGFSNENYEKNEASSPASNSVKFSKENCEDQPVSHTTVAT